MTNLFAQVPYGAGLQSRCTPGTLREVINMVTHLPSHHTVLASHKEIKINNILSEKQFYTILNIY